MTKMMMEMNNSLQCRSEMSRCSFVFAMIDDGIGRLLFFSMMSVTKSKHCPDISVSSQSFCCMFHAYASLLFADFDSIFSMVLRH